MVCIDNGMVWYALAFAMEMEMVWYGIHCLVISLHGMVWHGMNLFAIALYGMHWQWYGMVWYALEMEMLCIGNGNGMVW
jgi:hypothetical protein